MAIIELSALAGQAAGSIPSSLRPPYRAGEALSQIAAQVRAALERR